MSLTFKRITLPSAELNGESSLPPLADMSNVQNMTESQLGEDDGLFIGYGFLSSAFPYRMQDMYSRELHDRKYLSAVLENQYLRAEFLPELGGRLRSLFDKKAGRELLFCNPVIRYCNLAFKNAWISGGIEFNCGVIGHSPFTCSPLFTAATVLEDGTPVLRMYEFERIRRAVYQMDFFLPDNSPVLYARMRIVNPNTEVIPMYWWTNIAVPEGKNYRNIINADSAYTNKGNVVSKVSVPEFCGTDITYPVNNKTAVDYFWKIPSEKRKYTAYLDKDGNGFVQASTSRLKGRKLFVWGQGEGGARWQEFLTGDGLTGRYSEIQAGLASTQYECLPMPPKTAWEWLECYGALNADAEIIHGEWSGACEEASKKLEALVSESSMEKLLKDTHNMAVSPAEKTVFTGSGWGSLERIRRLRAGEGELCPHLDFGDCGKEQSEWLYLLENGKFSENGRDEMPVSWMLQSEWTAAVEASEDGHKKHLHLSAIRLSERKLNEAEENINKALEYCESPAALYIAAQILRIREKPQEAAEYAVRALKMLPGDISLARQALSLCLSAKLYDEVISVYESMSESVRADGRLTMLYAFAQLYTGNTDKAESLINREGGICVSDVREGEETITELYIEIQKSRARENGLTTDTEGVSVPREYDFRMFVPKKQPDMT